MDGTGIRRPLRVGMVTTFPPTRCGIARFSADLAAALERVAPDVDMHILRLVNDVREAGTDPRTITAPVAEIDPESSVGLRAAARILDRTDVALVQHEFGIFGRDDGAAVVSLLDQIRVPVITVLHTVRTDPTPAQRRIVEELADRGVVVVMCRSAREILDSVYGVAPGRVEVIHHGSHWTLAPPNPGPRRRVITWGLLGPGKGLERGITAMAQLQDMDPPPEYLIVGRTHPMVLAQSGSSYRRSLEELVVRLRVGHLVHFIDRYVDDDTLFELVSRADLVLVPYDNSEQMSSGVITEALGVGRPVVATRFPYATEMLQGGCGVVVDHDPAAVASAARALLEDESHYLAASAAAGLRSPSLAWSEVGARYANLARRVATARATA